MHFVRALVLTAIALAGTSFAQGGDPVTIDLDVFRLGPGGERIRATQAEPGDTVEYVLTSTNVGRETLPARIVVITMPVPAGVTYISGTATLADDLLLEFSSDGAGFMRAEPPNPVALRWTLIEEMQPGRAFEVSARVRVDGDPGNDEVGPQDPVQFDRDFDRFVQAMFGHLGVIQVNCPGDAVRHRVCGEYRRDFAAFLDSWDLYADWSSELPVAPPEPVTAWRRDGATYTRTYEMHGTLFGVAFTAGFVTVSP